MSNSYDLQWNEITEKNFYFYFFFGMSQGLTLRECCHGKGSDIPTQVQPSWYKGTYDEYANSIKTYIKDML